MRNCVFPNKTLEMYVQVATIEVLERKPVYVWMKQLA